MTGVSRTENELRDLLRSWMIMLRAERKSPETVRSYTTGVDAFLRWCRDNELSPALSRSRVSAWISAILADDDGATSTKPVSPATARSRQLAVRRFSAWLADESEIERDELLGIKPVKLDQKVTPALTDAQITSLLAACKGTRMQDLRDTAIVTVMIDTGIRAGECATLALDDVDLDRERLTIERGKGGKGRRAHLPPTAQSALDRYLRRGRKGHPRAESPDLWLGERGKTFSYDSLHQALTKRARDAGIDEFHPHILRHTFATRWLTDGGSEGSLMALAGWTRREMLDRYTRATASERAIEESRRLRG